MSDPIDIHDFGRELSEKKLETNVQQAEFVDVSATIFPDDVDKHTDKALIVELQTVSGMTVTDWLPMPDEYDPARSDLAVVFEFTGANVSEPMSLTGKRVPMAEGSVDYAAMRRVLRQEEAAVGQWDAEKRLQKVRSL